MASKEITKNLALEMKNDENQKKDEVTRESDPQSCVIVTEQIGQEVMEPIFEKENNSMEGISSSNTVAEKFEMAASTLPHDFTGFKSFGTFRKFDIAKLNEILKFHRESTEDYKSLVNEKDDSKLSLIENDDSKPSVNHNIPNGNSENTENENADKKPVRKRKLKRRKKWVIKKPAHLSKQKRVISSNSNSGNNILYQDLYQKCLDVTNSDGANIAKPKFVEENSSDSTVPEKNPILGMAVEVINKLKNEELNKKKEKQLQQQNQKIMLQKLINLLKEKAPVNGDTAYESTLPSQQISSHPSTLGSSLHKFKNNFYGFRSTKPQTRDRGGLITAEKLFANSPPSSPTHRGSTHDNNVEASPTTGDKVPLISSNNIDDLDFVFKPLSDNLGKISTDKLVSSNLTEKRNGIIRSGRTQPVNTRINLAGANRKIQNGLVKQMKRVNSKILKRKIIRNLKSRKEKEILVPQMDDKFESKVKDIPLKVKSLFTHCQDNTKTVFKVQATDRATKKGNQAKGGSGRKAIATKKYFSVRAPNGRFESLQKSGTSPATRQKIVPTGLKRKIDDVNKGEQTENNFKISATTSDIKKSRSVSETSTTNRMNRLHSEAKIQERLMPSESNSSLPEFSSPKSTLRSIDKLSPKSPSTNLEVSTLYYPVHPFISHDLPVHFIPIDLKNIPHFLPLYAPNVDAQSKAPIYPSFIRTRPSEEQKSAAEYVLSKGISTRTIPHRSFAEDKVRQNLFPGIASGTKCPLIPVVKKSLSLRNKEIKSDPDAASGNSVQSVSRESPKESIPTSLSNVSSNSSEHNTNPSNNPNQKIHKCLQCDFVTPRLGVLKRHELVHSKSNSEQTKDSRIQFKSSSEVTSSVRNAVKKAPVLSVARTDSRNLGTKTVRSNASHQKANEQKRNTGRLTSPGVNSS